MQEFYDSDVLKEKPAGSPASMPSGNRPEPAGTTGELSAASQARLDSLRNCLKSCFEELTEIRKELATVEFSEDHSIVFQKISEHLRSFCLEADSWGFESLYSLAFSLQTLLMNYSDRTDRDAFWEALNRGLSLIAVLLNQSQQDYRNRLETAELVDRIQDIRRS